MVSLQQEEQEICCKIVSSRNDREVTPEPSTVWLLKQDLNNAAVDMPTWMKDAIPGPVLGKDLQAIEDYSERARDELPKWLTYKQH